MKEFLTALSIVKDCSREENPLESLGREITRLEFDPVGVYLNSMYPQLEAFYTRGKENCVELESEFLAVDDITRNETPKF